MDNFNFSHAVKYFRMIFIKNITKGIAPKYKIGQEVYVCDINTEPGYYKAIIIGYKTLITKKEINIIYKIHSKESESIEEEHQEEDILLKRSDAIKRLKELEELMR